MQSNLASRAGIAAISAADTIFAEGYTSPLVPETLAWFEQEAGSVQLLSREEVEQPNVLLAAAHDSETVLLVGGGLGALQTGVIITGLPFALVILFIGFSLLRGLKDENLKV